MLYNNCEKIFAYEDRDEFQTSNWNLDGLDTRGAGNCSKGRLWIDCSLNGQAVDVSLYNDLSLAAENQVACGTVSAEGGNCELSQVNESGISGNVVFESFDSENAEPVELVVSLCGDSDLQIYYANLNDLPVYSNTQGMSQYCRRGSDEILSRVSRRYAVRLGIVPDFRLIGNLEALKSAAVHYALMLAFGACHESASETMYSQLRDWHEKQVNKEIVSLDLSFRDPADALGEPVYNESAASVRINRN